MQLCAPHPDGAQRVAGSLAQAPSIVVYLLTLALLYRLVRTADRHGPFSPRTTRGLQRIGWWLLLAAPAAAAGEAIARTVVFATLVSYPVGPGYWIADTQPPFALMITGAGLLTVARILQIGTSMREEIEATV